VTSPARTMRAVSAADPDPASLACQSLPVPEPAPGERPAVSITFELGDLAAAFRAQQHGPRPPAK